MNGQISTEDQIKFKEKLAQQCIAIIEERIANNLQLMNNAQEAANSESKSSAGDKYETSRAMNQLQKDMYATQLAANKKELAAFLSIKYNVINRSIGIGSIIICGDKAFFIAAGLGKLAVDDFTVFLLSPNAPLAKLLITKKIKDNFLFNKELLMIENAF